MDANAVLMEMCGLQNDDDSCGVAWEIWNGTVQYTVDTYQYLARQDLQLDDKTAIFNALPSEMKEKVMIDLLGVDIFHYSFSEEIDFTQKFSEAYSNCEDLDEYVFLQIHQGGDLRSDRNWSDWMMFHMVKDNQLTCPEVVGTCKRGDRTFRISNQDSKYHSIGFVDDENWDYPEDHEACFLDDDEVSLELANIY